MLTRQFAALMMPMTAVLMATAPVLATEFIWTFQRVTQYPEPSSRIGVAMALGEGATFPTVFYEDDDQFDEQVVGDRLGPLGWNSHGLGFASMNPSYRTHVRTEVGQGGQTGVVWKGDTTIHFAQSTGTVWQTSTLETGYPGHALSAPDMTYRPDGDAVVAYSDTRLRTALRRNGGWEVDTPLTPSGEPIDAQYVTVAVDSQSRLGCAYYAPGSASIAFAYQDPVLSTWSTSTAMSSSGPGFRHLSLAFDHNDAPGIAYLHASADVLHYAWFDIVSGTWMSEQIASNVVSGTVDLVFDSQGHPAMAFLGNDGVVHYATNQGTGWADVTLPISDPATQLNLTPLMLNDVSVALAFDDDDLPVISYFSQSGLLLAYDPILTPEPTAAVLMICLGSALLLRRRA